MFRSPMMRIFLVLLLCVTVGACGDKKNAIGKTVKGTRIAVVQRNKGVQADSDLRDIKPQIPPMATNTAWAQAGYDTTHVMPNVLLAASPNIQWTASIGAGSSSDYKLLARPVVMAGRIYTMDAEGTVSAFSTKNGDRLWEFETTPEDRDEAIGGGIGVDGDTVYSTTGYGEVIAINKDNGTFKWRHKLTNPVRGAPTIAEGRVYAVTIDNELQTLDARTGGSLWHHNGIAESATLMGASSPAVVGDSVVVAYTSGEIFNLRAENGRASWNYALTTATQVGALPAIADIRGLPVVDKGRVFAISHSGRMAAIDQRTGERAWEADLGGINTPLSAGDTVFVLSNEHQLVALSRESGRILWAHALQDREDMEDPDSDPVYWAGPVLGGNRLWLTNSLGQLVSFVPDRGDQGLVIDLGNPVYISPIIANGVIYCVTDNGKLIALR